MTRTKRDQTLIDELTFRAKVLGIRLLWKNQYIKILEDRLGLDDDALDDLKRKAKREARLHDA